MQKKSVKTFVSTATLKRPNGPSWFDLSDLADKDASYCNLDYPVKLNRKYGNIVYSSPFKLYLLSGADAFQHVLTTNSKNYVRQQNVYNRMRFTFGNSLLVNEGEAWKYRRKIALPAYQHKALQHYAPTISTVTANKIHDWQIKLPAKIDLLSTLNQLTLAISLNLFCQQELPIKIVKFLGEAIAFCNYYCSHAAWIHPFKPTLSNAKFFWLIRKIDKILLHIIVERRKNPIAATDLMHFLLTAHNEETGKPLTDLEILAEFKTHLITGHETTASGLSWMWYLLSENPTYLEPLEAELEQVLNGRLPVATDVPKLVYTKAIISESFRLYPPIWSLARTNLEPDVLEGYEIPKNSRLSLHLYALHRNPNYWDEPLKFYPERFLESDAKRHPFAFLPFSAGSHTCIASHLATLETTLIAATLAQKVRFQFIGKSKVIAEPCISLRPRGGIMMRPTWKDR